MAGMVRASPHLPSVTAVSVDTLFLVVMMCSLVEVRRILSQERIFLLEVCVQRHCRQQEH